MINLIPNLQKYPPFPNLIRDNSKGVRWARRKKRGLIKKIKYGINAPLSCELIYVPTQAIKNYDKDFNGNRSCSGEVTSHDWDPHYLPIDKFPKIQFCFQHWRDGVPWKETGVYERMMMKIAVRGSMDGCQTLDDVVARYEALDKIYETVKHDGFLRSQMELKSRKRENGGILIHIDRFGKPVFGLGGCHRLSMALILNFDYIPAQIGLVHPDGIKYLAHYRKGSKNRKNADGLQRSHVSTRK